MEIYFKNSLRCSKIIMVFFCILDMLASENENADVLGASENKMGVAKFQHLDQSASQKKMRLFSCKPAKN